MKCLHCDTEMEIYESEYGTEMVRCSGCGYHGIASWLESESENVDRMLKEWFQRIEEFPNEIKVLLVREAVKSPYVFATGYFGDFCVRNKNLFNPDTGDTAGVDKVIKLATRMDLIIEKLERRRDK